MVVDREVWLSHGNINKSVTTRMKPQKVPLNEVNGEELKVDGGQMAH